MPFELLIAAVAGLIVCLMMSWQQNVKTVLWLLVIEGALRKWFIPGAADLIYFAKDGVLLIAYFQYFLSPPVSYDTTEPPKTLVYLILLNTLFILFSAFNPHLGSPLVGIVGIRNYIFYIPLMFIVRHLFDSQEDLVRFLRVYLLVSLPIFALSLIQYSSPRDSFINTYVAGENTPKSGLVGSKVRVTGSFSYIAGYAAYLQTITALALPLLILRHSAGWQFLLRIIFALAIGGMALTGSRGPILSLLLLIVGYLALNKTVRQLGLYKKLLGVAVVCGLIGAIWLGTAFENYAGRFKKNDDLFDRVKIYFVTPLNYVEVAGVTGYGAGATYQAVSRLRTIFSLRPGTPINVYYESEPERIMLELGLIGFIFWYLLRVYIIIELWRTYKRLKLPLTRELALIAMLVHLIALPHQMVFQITFMVYYWFFAGFMFLLPEIEQREAIERHVIQQKSEGLA